MCFCRSLAPPADSDASSLDWAQAIVGSRRLNIDQAHEDIIFRGCLSALPRCDGAVDWSWGGEIRIEVDSVVRAVSWAGAVQGATQSRHSEIASVTKL